MKGNIKDGRQLAVDNTHTRVAILFLYPFCKFDGYIVMTVDVDLFNDRCLNFSLIFNFHFLINTVKDNSCGIIFTAGYHSQFTNPGSFSLIIDAINEQGIDHNVIIADQIKC